MTLLGKVFIGIVFVLSIVFFTVSLLVNASHINYRDMVEDKNTGLKSQLAREQAKSQELSELVQKQKDAMAVEQLARRSALAALQTQLEMLSSDVSEKEKELSASKSQLTQLAATEQLTQQQLAARTKENEELRNQLVQARQDRDSQYQKFVQTYDQFIRLQGDKETLEKETLALSRKSAAAEANLSILGITPETKLDGPPPVNGLVTDVSNNLVEVSIGKDDGVRVGHQLDVYRGGRYLGRINIIRSADDKAVGEVMPSYSKGFISKGDRVDSRLNEVYVKRPAAQ
ncbi:MAG: hypothetical protein ACTHOU_07295 [Aureliella sp.]|jgi:multidrug efflux pump subunit AcrA (membrane-fusion protein)